MKKVLFSAVILAVTATASAQSGGLAADAAIVGASMEQGRQWAIDQRVKRERAAIAEQQFYISQQRAIESQRIAEAQAWANMRQNAMEKSRAGAINTQRKKAGRAATIAKVQQKYREKQDSNLPASQPLRTN